MGFDVYGLKPHNPKKLVKPEIDWATEPTEEEKEKFFRELEYYEKSVPGHYFRNNVWWWRPLWGYVEEFTDVLEPEQVMEGFSNSGVEINEQDSIDLAIALHKLIDDDHTRMYEEDYMREYELANIRNKELEEARKIIHENVVAETGDENIAPINYPEKWRADWDALWSQKDWTGNYPFSVDNVKQFADFCYQSGGFQIW